MYVLENTSQNAVCKLLAILCGPNYIKEKDLRIMPYLSYQGGNSYFVSKTILTSSTNKTIDIGEIRH